MRFPNYAIIAITFIICMVTPIFVYTYFNNKAEQSNERYAAYLSTATKDAAAIAGNDDGYAFDTQPKRDTAISTFYESMAACFSASFSQAEYDTMKHYIPCVILLDNDGFYIHYSGDYTADSIQQENYVTTPLYTFSGAYGDYNVRYFLNGDVSVYWKGIYLEEGDPADVYQSLFDRGYNPTILDFFQDTDEFHEEEIYAITSTVLEKAEYYINAQNDSIHNRHDAWYGVTIPQVSGQDWARAINGSTVLSFFQGPQMPYGIDYRNTYALCGGEVDKDEEYFVKKGDDGVLYYHMEGCSELGSDYDGRQYGTMEQCALYGAYPCAECIR